MKKKFLLLCWLCLAIVLVGCKKNECTYNQYDEVRKAAWDILSTEAKKEVTHSWKDAQVSKGKFDVYNPEIDNSRYIEHYCYRVSFDTEKNALLGPKTIFLDICTLEYLGTIIVY